MATLEDAIQRGDAYTWNALSADVDAGDTLILLKSGTTRKLRIAEIVIQGGNVDSLYVIHRTAAAATTPTGTAITAIAINGAKSNDASAATAVADETAYAQGVVIEQVAVKAGTRVAVNMHGMILINTEAIAVDQVTESTAGGVTIRGFFE